MDVLNNIKDKYERLPRAQKKVASFFYHFPEKAAMLTAIDIGENVGVSDTSVIRLSYSLGYESFGDMQKQLKKNIMNKIEKTDDYADGQNPATDHIPFEYTQLMKNVSSCSAKMKMDLDYGKLEKFTDLLIGADSILVMGYYGDHSVAFEFQLMLDAVRPNVSFFRTTPEGYRSLSMLTDKSVVVAVSYPAYSQNLVNFVKLLKNKDATVVAITDDVLSPVSREADITIEIPIYIDEETNMKCMSSVMEFFYFVIMGIKFKNRENIIFRLNNVANNLTEISLVDLENNS